MNLSWARLRELVTQAPKKVLGVVLIICVVFIWVGSSVAIQAIFADASFDKPLFLTYFSTTLFSVYLLGLPIIPRWRRSITGKISQTQQQEDESTSSSSSQDFSAEQEVAIDFRKVMLTALKMCPLWFAANVMFNYSLAYTSVSSNTIISTTSSLFTFILGLILGIDNFSFLRLAAIGCSITGVTLVTLSDTQVSKDAKNALVGNTLSLLSAFAYGCYTTVLKKSVPEDDKSAPMPLIFGFVGVFNFLVLWPLFFPVHFSGLEPFEFPSIYVFLMLLGNGLIGTVLSDLLWALSVVYTSPVVSTIGLSLTIPLAILADLILGKKLVESILPLYWVGSCLVILAFVIVNVSYQLTGRIKSIDQPGFLDRIKEFIKNNRYKRMRMEEDEEIPVTPTTPAGVEPEITQE